MGYFSVICSKYHVSFRYIYEEYEYENEEHAHYVCERQQCLRIGIFRCFEAVICDGVARTVSCLRSLDRNLTIPAEYTAGSHTKSSYSSYSIARYNLACVRYFR
jgi:hypothetical protein